MTIKDVLRLKNLSVVRPGELIGMRVTIEDTDQRCVGFTVTEFEIDGNRIECPLILNPGSVNNIKLMRSDNPEWPYEWHGPYGKASTITFQTEKQREEKF